MSKSEIIENLSIVTRNAEMILDKLDSADLNITEERRLLNSVKKAKKILGDAQVVM